MGRNNVTMPLGHSWENFYVKMDTTEDLDPDCSIRVYRSFFKQVFKRPLMGPPGAPFRLGPGTNTPVTPMWAVWPLKLQLYFNILSL